MAATVQSAQPMFLSPGTAPMAPVPVSVAVPESVMYYPQTSGGLPQGAAIMVSIYTFYKFQ